MSPLVDMNDKTGQVLQKTHHGQPGSPEGPNSELKHNLSLSSEDGE